MKIEDIKNSIRGVQAELEQARAAGIAMADDPNATTQAMTSQMDKVTRLSGKLTLLQAELADQEGLQGQGAAMTQISDDDQVSKGAARFQNMGDFFCSVAHQRSDPDPRLTEYGSIRSAATGQNITTDADGGYLVPPEYSSELLRLAQSESVIYPMVRHTPITGNRLIENYVLQDSRKDKVESASAPVHGRSGVLAYWKGEAEQYAASKIRFGQMDTSLTKLTGMAYATEEMLEDYAAMSSIISDSFRDEFAFKIDDGILNGTGSGMPKGILATGSTGNGALVTIAQDSGQAAGTISVSNILKMWNALPANLRANAVWLCNQDVEIALMQLAMQTGTVSSGGSSAVEEVSGAFSMPVYLPAGGLSASPYGTLLGRELRPVEQCAALGSLGDLVLFAPSTYRWIDKGGVKAQTSIHVRFDYDETAFKFSYRCNGYPMWPNAIEAYKGSTKRSPYVALAARA